jgi:hypothetical protein
MIQSHEYLEAFRAPTERLVNRIFQIVLKITCELQIGSVYLDG